MAHCVNTLIHAVQTPGRDPPIHHSRVQAQPDKLKERHHPVLLRR
jgi:hypothetical protein